MVERKEIAFSKSGQYVCKWSTNLIKKHFQTVKGHDLASYCNSSIQEMEADKFVDP